MQSLAALLILGCGYWNRKTEIVLYFISLKKKRIFNALGGETEMVELAKLSSGRQKTWVTGIFDLGISQPISVTSPKLSQIPSSVLSPLQPPVLPRLLFGLAQELCYISPPCKSPLKQSWCQPGSSRRSFPALMML